MEEAGIPTFEEYVENFATMVSDHPIYWAVKAISGMARHFIGMHLALVGILVEKGVLDPNDPKTLGERIEKGTKIGDHELLKSLIQEAAKGAVKLDSGKTLTPDDVSTVFTRILIDARPIDAEAVLTLGPIFGWTEEMMREQHATLVVSLQKDAKRQSRVEKEMADLEQELQERKAHREARARELETGPMAQKLQSYRAWCRVRDIPLPSKEKALKMLRGEVPIPDPMQEM